MPDAAPPCRTACAGFPMCGCTVDALGPPAGYSAFEWLVMDLRYAGLTWRDVAKHAGRSPQRCCEALEAVLARLDAAAAAERRRPARRTCLGCRTPFVSTWAGHRQCERCRERASHIDDTEIPAPCSP